MAGPWDNYAGQSTAPAPWEKYGQNDERNSLLGLADTAIRGAADAVTLGFADEIAAGLGTGFGMLGDYDAELARQRGIDKTDMEHRPWIRMGGQVAGGVGAGVLAAPATLSATLAPASLLGRVGAGVADGAIMGGVYGFGSGEGLPDRGMGLLEGGAMGGAAGGAFPLAAAGAGKAYEAVANALAAKPIAASVGARPETLRALGGILDADGSLGAAGQANMARAGQSAMLADAGPTARSVLDTSIQRGGPGAIVARDRIGARLSSDSDALVAALNQSMGRPGESLSRDLIVYGDRTNPVSLLYRKAYSTPIDYSQPAAQEIEAMVRGRVPPAAIKAANDLMRVEGVESQQILANIADDGSVVFEKLPDVRQLDYITRGLNQVAQSAEGQGAMGGTTPIGRAYGNLSREIRSRLKDLVPEYKVAVDRAGTEIGKVQAQEFGSTLFSPSVTRDQVREFVADISQAERNKLVQGARSQIDDAMARVTRTVQDGDVGAREAVQALKSLSSRANREKLTLALGEQQTDALFKELDRVATSFDLRAGVADNSRTYGRLAAQERVRDMAAPNAVGTLAQGSPLQAAKSVVQALTGQTPEAVKRREDAIFSQIAELLTRPGGAGQQTYDAIRLLNQTDASTSKRIDAIASLLMGPKTSYPPTLLLQDMRE